MTYLPAASVFVAPLTAPSFLSSVSVTPTPGAPRPPSRTVPVLVAGLGGPLGGGGGCLGSISWIWIVLVIVWPTPLVICTLTGMVARLSVPTASSATHRFGLAGSLIPSTGTTPGGILPSGRGRPAKNDALTVPVGS